MFSFRNSDILVVETIRGYLKLMPDLVYEPEISRDPELYKLLDGGVRDYSAFTHRLYEVIEVVRRVYNKLKSIEEEHQKVQHLLKCKRDGLMHLSVM
jgi:hypothetical protein